MTIEVGLLLGIIQTCSSLFIVPLVGAMWSMNSRISNIEGVLHGLEKKA